jgi:diguanylate cyclase (GGDEF)-like protein
MATSLDQIIASDRLPSLPQLALRVIELARAPEPDFAEVTRIVRTDPALSSKMLRTANSALFGLRHRVQSIEAAIPMLGITVVRTIVLGFSLATQRRPGDDIQRPLQKLWRSSLTQAVFAELMAEHTQGADPPTYFLAGLLQDVGILAAMHVSPDEYLDFVWDTSDFPNTLASERRHFGFTHIEITKQLCERWGLPEDMVEAMALHHSRLQTDARGHRNPLTPALQAANLCAQYIENLHRAGNREFDELAVFLNERYGWKVEQTEELLRDTIMRVGETAALYSFDVGTGWSSERILDDAKRILEEIALHSQLGSMARTRQAAVPSDSTAASTAMTDEAMRDAMTGVFNRRFMDRVLNERLSHDIRQKKPMGFLFLDVDRFKRINDEHGHQVGDEAIRCVASVLKGAVRNSDYVIRYGGDEFLVALLRVSTQEVEQIAERIRHEIHDTELNKNLDVKITSSVGALHYQPEADDSLDANWLVDQVDKAMYEAKRNGGDQVRLYEVVGHKLSAASAAVGN